MAGLVITSIYNIITSHNPTTTEAGIIIALISIVIMRILAYAKIEIGNELRI